MIDQLKLTLDPSLLLRLFSLFLWNGGSRGGGGSGAHHTHTPPLSVSLSRHDSLSLCLSTSHFCSCDNPLSVCLSVCLCLCLSLSLSPPHSGVCNEESPRRERKRKNSARHFFLEVNDAHTQSFVQNHQSFRTLKNCNNKQAMQLSEHSGTTQKLDTLAPLIPKIICPKSKPQNLQTLIQTVLNKQPGCVLEVIYAQ